MPKVLTPQARLARYERIRAMRNLTPPMTLEAIGKQFDPPLSKQRVTQILAHPEKAGRREGRPDGPNKRADLQHRLAFWEQRRANRVAEGADAAYANGRIAAITEELAGLAEERVAVPAT